jgi:hypothetical protein
MRLRKLSFLFTAFTLFTLFTACSSHDGDSVGVTPATQALEPDDLIPPTTYVVRMVLQTPAPAYAMTMCSDGKVCCEGAGCGPCSGQGCKSNPMNFTPEIDWLSTDPRPSTLGPIWNVSGALGVRVNNLDWSSQACMFGRISQAPTGVDIPCAATVSVPGGPNLSFGVVGSSLIKTFQISSPKDTVNLMAVLDDIGEIDSTTVSNGWQSALGAAGTGAGAVGGLFSTIGAFADDDDLGALGTLVSFIGNLAQLIASIPAMSQDPNAAAASAAQTNCLGGILGNPPPGSSTPPDTFTQALTGEQLYDGTRNGSLTLGLHARMNYQPALGHPSNSPWCTAATEIKLVIDRAGADRWTDGLAFQPRNADNAVVRRANAVESFRVDPTYNRLEHDSWRYAGSEASYHPTDGLPKCNAVTPCSPGDGAAGHSISEEASENYVGGFSDLSAQFPPRLTDATTPIVAHSPDSKHIAAFFVDDNGRLYISAASYPDDDPTSEVPYWQTWLLASGLPPRAPIAALRAMRRVANVNLPIYSIYFAGTDGAVHQCVLSGDKYSGLPDPSGQVVCSALSTPITTAGAHIAAVSRTPAVADVFVVGNAISRLTGGPGSSLNWTVATVGPTASAVSPLSGVTAVATTVNNMDLFYFDVNKNLKHLVWTNLPAPEDNRWDWGATSTVVGASPLTLSAASRSPNDIDLVYACGSALCNISLTANVVSNLNVSAAPPFPAALPINPSDPFSIVATTNFALDVIAASGPSAYDLSWQTGGTSWKLTAPQSTYSWSDGKSFRLYVTPKQLSIAANNSASVSLYSMLVDPAAAGRTITLSSTTAPGVNAGQYNPTTLTAGSSTGMGYWVPLGTAPTPYQTITITGNNGVESHSVTFQVATTACVPLTTCGGAPACGSIDNGCGGKIQCGAACCTAADVCTPDTCGSTFSNRCGGTVKCPACRACPPGRVFCGGACVPLNFCQ